MSLLDELKEKRQDAIENFETQGADIEVTREQLADQQRVRAFWAAQIVDLDKAISALTPEGKEALLESQPEPVHTEVRKQDEQDAAGDWTNGGEDRLDAVCAELLAAPSPPQEAPAIPEGFIPWSGGYVLSRTARPSWCSIETARRWTALQATKCRSSGIGQPLSLTTRPITTSSPIASSRQARRRAN